MTRPNHARPYVARFADAVFHAERMHDRAATHFGYSRRTLTHRKVRAISMRLSFGAYVVQWETSGKGVAA